MASQPNVPKDASPKASSAWRAHAAAAGELRRLERVFAACEWPERGFTRARRRARERALEILEGDRSEGDATRDALLVGAAELFRALTTGRAIAPPDASRLASQIEDVTGLSPIMLAREVLRAPELLATSTGLAVEVLLATLVAFAPLRSVSLWTHDAAERANCVCHVGEDGPSRGVRQLGARLLAGDAPEPGASSARTQLIGLPVGRRGPPVAALVGSARPSMRDTCQVFLEEAVPMLGAVVERDILRAENAASERALVESSERKLTRLGFDLHDGPIQDVAVLAHDLRLFRDQLEPLLGPLSEHELVRGRIEDLDAQLGAIDSELRRLASEVQAASVLLRRPFRAAVSDRVRAFAARTGIRPHVTLAGEAKLSTSQQIALLNIIQEALSNIREHAGASNVEITVSADEQGVEAKVTDDGRGFDLESTLMRAAREGRIGLLAMNERVRLLGGQFRIESRPGGPTAVYVALERWLPFTQSVASADRGTRSRSARGSRKAQPSRATR
jgi:signal transduction histidine kinase